MTCESLPLFGIDTISSSDIPHLSWMGSMQNQWMWRVNSNSRIVSSRPNHSYFALTDEKSETEIW